MARASDGRSSRVITSTKSSVGSFATSCFCVCFDHELSGRQTVVLLPLTFARNFVIDSCARSISGTGRPRITLSAFSSLRRSVLVMGLRCVFFCGLRDDIRTERQTEKTPECVGYFGLMSSSPASSPSSSIIFVEQQPKRNRVSSRRETVRANRDRK